jgi:purine-binding chemotaxis protein CheW
MFPSEEQKSTQSDAGLYLKQASTSRERQSEQLLDEVDETARIGKLELRKREILKARAQTAARKKGQKGNEKVIEVVKFLLDDQMYAFEVNQLREVCTLSRLTAIPCSPKFVVGVINLRGQIIPIVDLRAFLEIPAPKTMALNKAIIMEKEDVCVGFLADEVVRAEKFSEDMLQGALATMTGINAECLKGVAKDKTVLLDAAKILANPKLYSASSLSDAGTR